MLGLQSVRGPFPSPHPSRPGVHDGVGLAPVSHPPSLLKSIFRKPFGNTNRTVHLGLTCVQYVKPWRRVIHMSLRRRWNRRRPGISSFASRKFVPNQQHIPLPRDQAILCRHPGAGRVVYSRIGSHTATAPTRSSRKRGGIDEQDRAMMRLCSSIFRNNRRTTKPVELSVFVFQEELSHRFLPGGAHFALFNPSRLSSTPTCH
ncbi:hypothetical protein LY76DRAFT_330102 [Colletotrichum caudatum]|nr:hypothetical protein LY76DRAFT_330102 [Colletotrichum caudatum]